MRISTLTLTVASTVASGIILGAATTAGAAPPSNLVGFANLAMTQMLTVGPTGQAITTWADGTPAQVFDMVYQVDLPTEPGMSSPYQLRGLGTNLCLQDVGDGRSVITATCETSPAEGSAQLWQNHHVADRTVDGRKYYFRFNRATDRVLTAAPTTENADSARVLSRPAEPISKSGAADAQLWVMLAA